MAFRFGDPGGRMYGSTGNLLAHWTSISQGAGCTFVVSAGNGRTTGGSCLRYTLTNGGQANQVAMTKVLDNQATWGVTLAIRASSLPVNQGTIIQLSDSGTVQIDLRTNTIGTLSVTRNGTVLGTTSALMSSNTWLHVELKVKIDPSVGTVYLAVNGVQQLNLTAQNTRASANSFAQTVVVGNIIGNSAFSVIDFDDIIVYDGQTTDANGFTDITGPIGDCGLAWILPDGAGTTTQFSPSSGSNFAAVDDTTPNGDTDYAESGTVGQTDTYSLGSLPSGATSVKSIAVMQYARKTDIGSRGMKAVVRSGGGNTTHATEQAMADTYQYFSSPFGQNPNNGSPTNWTVSAVNALEAGQTVSS